MVAHNRVLVVDDEEGVRRSWKRFLSQRGHDVSTAPDGDSAISQLARHPADVVVSDLRMPGRDGMEVLRWIRARQPETRFVLFTGYGSPAVEKEARELGAYEYLEKPITPDHLASIIARALAAPIRPPVADATPDVEEEARVAPEAEQPLPEKAPEPAPKEEPSRAATVAVLLASPIIGAAFVLFLPILGFGMIGWLFVQKARKLLRRDEEPG